uniref:F-box domain-containing protein n=1 Tax=Oryza punctata TaxID=4537 RepID=A0A0E0LZT5_ORYPU
MDLPDELVESVLLRLDSSVSLIRAASTCKPWRRIVANAGFLRRSRGLHKPTVAGYYFDSRPESRFEMLTMGRQIALCFQPSPSAAALAIDAGRFSLAFLRDNDVLPPRWSSSWSVADSRGSLVLLRSLAAAHAPFGFPDLVVCEPLTRRHRRILPSPDFNTSCYFYGCYLANGDEAAGEQPGSSIGISNFRVVYELYRDDGAWLGRAAVFAAGADGAHSWRETVFGHAIPSFHRMSLMGRAGGSWYFREGSTMAVLDGGTAEFSSSSFALQEQQPIDPSVYPHDLYIAEGRDGEPRMFTTTGGILTVFARARRPVVAGDGEDEEWAVEKRIRLSEATRGLPGYDASFFFGGDEPMNVITRGAGFVVLSPRLRTTKEASPARWWFAVDLETAEVERVHEDLGMIQFPCELPWPPNLRACVE